MSWVDVEWTSTDTIEEADLDQMQANAVYLRDGLYDRFLGGIIQGGTAGASVGDPYRLTFEVAGLSWDTDTWNDYPGQHGQYINDRDISQIPIGAHQLSIYANVNSVPIFLTRFVFARTDALVKLRLYGEIFANVSGVLAINQALVWGSPE